MSSFAIENVILAQLFLFLFSPSGQVQMITASKTESCYLSCSSISSKVAGNIRHLPGHVQRSTETFTFCCGKSVCKVLERIRRARSNVPFHQTHSTLLN